MQRSSVRNRGWTKIASRIAERDREEQHEQDDREDLDGLRAHWRAIVPAAAHHPRCQTPLGSLVETATRNKDADESDTRVRHNDRAVETSAQNCCCLPLTGNGV